MSTYRLLPFAIFSAGAALGACHPFSYSFVQDGIITSRAPRGVGQTLVPAMLVTGDTSSSHHPCGRTIFYLNDDVRVVRENGSSADTGALTLGRRVSVYIAKDQGIFLSCPGITSAAKIVLH